jgi:hypothetical protein
MIRKVLDPMSAGEREQNRACQKGHRDRWVVVQRHGNASAFNGYRWQDSGYSSVRCLGCGRYWRTRASYVESLPDETRAQAATSGRLA